MGIKAMMRAFMLPVMVALVTSAGCAVGAGPYAGYSTTRGFVYGGEIGAGLVVGQLAMGIQNIDRFRYLRVDVTGNSALYRPARGYGVGGRLGAGYGHGSSGRSSAVFALGGSLGYQLERMTCKDAGTIGLFGLELRYAAGEWQFVAVSRIESHTDFCISS